MVTGLVAAAILVSIRLAQRPAARHGAGPGRRDRRRRPDEADDLGRGRRAARSRCCSSTTPRRCVRAPAAGVGGLRGARARPRLRHHVDRPPDAALRPAHAAAREPPRRSARSSTTSARAVRSNGPLHWSAMLGYLTLPGVVLAVDRRRRRRAPPPRRPRPSSASGRSRVLASALLLALWPYPRYFAAAIVPLSAFVALGARGRSGTRIVGGFVDDAAAGAIAVACASSLLVALTPGPALRGRGARRPRARRRTRAPT